MEPVISVNNLSKQFKAIKAVENISFTVHAGEVYGFLGQNGAGKSTTIRMLLSLIQPDSGTIRLFGQPVTPNSKKVLVKVGAVIERPDLYKYLTAYENVNLFAKMSGVNVSAGDISRQLEVVGLSERRNSKVRTFSQGMKQRLGIAVALVHNPGLIILDEPTNGLDPQGIADIRNLIMHLSRNEGKTVFVSSHLLNEIQSVADRMLILDKGRLVKEGAMNELFDPAGMEVRVSVTNADLTSSILAGSHWQTMLESSGQGHFNFRISQQLIPELTRFLCDQGSLIQAIEPRHSLEKYFLSLTSENQHVDNFKN